MLWVRRVAGAVGVLGVVMFAALGVLLDSAGAVLGWVIVGLLAAVAAWTPTYVKRLEVAPERRPRVDVGVALRRAILTAAFSTAALLAISGMIAVMGPAAAPVLLLIAPAIIGWAWWGHRERTRRRDGATLDEIAHRTPSSFKGVDTTPPRHEDLGTFDDGPAIGVGAGALSDEELCLAWRRSFVTIEHLHDPRLRDHIARRRRGYLDEIERRHPGQFAEWLAAGARAASDPARFLPTSGSATPRQGG